MATEPTAARHPNLASERFGAAAIACNDEFFAPMVNLTKDAPPVFDADRYTDHGKWMDGWETRRRRVPGEDWCVVRLGLAGVPRRVVVDTAHFTGNFPEAAELAAGAFDSDDEALAAPPEHWWEVVPRSPLAGGSPNEFAAVGGYRATHMRLVIHPDGGVARLRVYGEVVPDWEHAAGGEIDLASIEWGGEVESCSDAYFCDPGNLLLPGPPRTMGDGWETKRRRGPGNDWVIVRLGVPGEVRRVVVDTSLFKGNAPGWISLAGRLGDGDWRDLVPRAEVEAHAENVFTDFEPAGPVDALRLDIHPDGGVARLRVFGIPDPVGLAAAGTRRLNVLAPRRARMRLLACCGSVAWADRVAAARPYEDFAELLATAEQIWWELEPEDWLEAFRAHPRIGERAAAGAPAAAWSEDEQAGVVGADATVEERLRRANAAYEERFGHIFIVFATGKSPEEMLARLEERMGNDQREELEVAAAEQSKITRLRLHKLTGVDPAALAGRRP